MISMQGFYAVYKVLFMKVADEESEYMKEGAVQLPEFGELIDILCIVYHSVAQSYCRSSYLN